MSEINPENLPATEQGNLYPVLPLRDIVVFPHMIVPLFVGREKSVRALEDVMKDDKQILLVAQKNAAQDDPTTDEIYRVGTVSTVLQLLKLPDGTVKVLVEGGRRARVSRYSENTGTKAWEKAPSANRRRMKLGILKATKNASVPPLAPNIRANTISRTSPSMRDRKVIRPTTAVDLSSRRLRAILPVAARLVRARRH